MITCFDAGHGGDKPGAIYGSYVEKDIALTWAKLLERTHEAHWSDLGCTFMTRTTDVNPSWAERKHEADYADALVSVHVNSGGGRGLEVFYFSQAGHDLADLIFERWPGPRRAVKDDTQTQHGEAGLWILRNTKPPAVLVELGFIDDGLDMRLLHDLDFGLRASQEIIQALEDWHNGRA